MQTKDENLTGKTPFTYKRPALRDRMLCFAKKIMASIAPYNFISHTKMWIVFERVGPRIILLES